MHDSSGAFFSLAPTSFGIFAGATLQEVAQVVAAVSIVPASMDAGVATKFLRVLFLAPTMLILGVFLMRRGMEIGGARTGNVYALVSSVWFVFGFLIIGILHTIVAQWGNVFFIVRMDQIILSVARFLMAMAMAGVGLQVGLKQLLKQGQRLIAIAVVGWLFLAIIAGVEVYMMHF